MKKGLHCPECKTYLDLPKQMMEADAEYGDDVELGAEFPWVITVRCEKCDKTAVMIFVEPARGERTMN